MVSDFLLALLPCLSISASPSDRKLSRAREMASRSAPAWLDRPPPLTAHSRSKRPSTPKNWSGNISCSLDGGEEEEGENDQEIMERKKEVKE